MSTSPESEFKDHFSGHAVRYASSRPGYPDALFAFLASQCPGKSTAWDCATGNGQAAHSLLPYFERVVATDASEEQIARAKVGERIEFRVARAEASGLDDGSVDLVTVAQALHWFDIGGFFDEAGRVLVPGGVVAAWCYGLCSVTPGCDEIVRQVYAFVDAYWPPERQTVEDGYRGIELPLPELACPPFYMRATWSAEQMLAYLDSWSATQRYRRTTGKDPVAGFAAQLRARWGGGVRMVTWPITLRAGRKPGGPGPNR